MRAAAAAPISLLGDKAAHGLSDVTYHIKIDQTPTYAHARIPTAYKQLSPSPICQFRIFGHSRQIVTDIQDGSLFCMLTLCDAATQRPLSTKTHSIVGQRAVSITHMRDHKDLAKISSFFMFPYSHLDVQEGAYCLNMSLFQLIGGRVTSRAHVQTAAFTVLPSGVARAKASTPGEEPPLRTQKRELVKAPSGSTLRLANDRLPLTKRKAFSPDVAVFPPAKRRDQKMGHLEPRPTLQLSSRRDQFLRERAGSQFDPAVHTPLSLPLPATSFSPSYTTSSSLSSSCSGLESYSLSRNPSSSSIYPPPHTVPLRLDSYPVALHQEPSAHRRRLPTLDTLAHIALSSERLDTIDDI